MSIPTMSAPQRIAMLFAAGLAICAGGFTYAVKEKVNAEALAAKPPATSVVKLIMKDGHGSGVGIGGGFIVTAAHVAADGILWVQNSLGEQQKAETLWINKEYDIALLKLSKPEAVGVSNLSCRAPRIGEPITAVGSPLRTEFTTYWGHANGSVGKFGPWSEVFSMDLTTLPGISGGPIFDKDNNVVGLAVGVAMLPMGMSASVTGIGYGVPGSSICKLLART